MAGKRPWRHRRLALDPAERWQPVHVNVQTHGANLNVESDVWQRAKDDIEGNRTCEVAGVISND